MNAQRARLNPLGLAMTVVIAAAVAFGSLFWMSRPQQGRDRLGHIGSIIARGESLVHQHSAAIAAPPGAICEGHASTATSAYASALAARARSAGVMLGETAFEPSADSGSQRVELKFTATGSYVGLMTLLRGIGEQKPSLRIKAVDLRPRADAVELQLRGAFWCSA